MTSRRTILASAAFAAASLVTPAAVGRAFAGSGSAFAQILAALAARHGGRLGVALLDTASGVTIGHMENERFPMCSTFKVVAVGALLKRVDTGTEKLDRKVRFRRSDLQSYSPGTKDFADTDGMTLAEICAAALTLSDNTAANLILDAIGGPEAVTQFARSIGDGETRLDRIEPDLNECRAGDPRDTTTPAAMVHSLARLALGDALSPAGRARLVDWLKASKTGARRLRAGLPADWAMGDKTGSGDFGTTNDVALIWPPNRKPLVAAVYLTGKEAPMEAREAVLAEVGRAIAAHKAS